MAQSSRAGLCCAVLLVLSLRGADAWAQQERAALMPPVVASPPEGALLELQPWLTETDTKAVCSDGSPAGACL